MSDHFQFDSVFIKKSNQTVFLKSKLNQSRFKSTGFDSVILEQKLVPVRLFYIKNQKLYCFFGYFCNF